jgi:hypothetical protein
MDGQFGLMSGTSMASPMATAMFTYLFGLHRAKNPTLEPLESKKGVLEKMCMTARPMKDRARCGILDLVQATKEILYG